jgi:hypothetical protein
MMALSSASGCGPEQLYVGPNIVKAEGGMSARVGKVRGSQRGAHAD